MNLEGISHEDEERCCRGYGRLHGCFSRCLRRLCQLRSLHRDQHRSLHRAATGEKSTGVASGFTVQLGSNPETLDPALNSAIDGANTLITVFEPLLLIDENNEVIPGQAESYTVSEDGLTWTFTMRDGLKWSDGSDLTAKDFEYSFKRLAAPDTAAPYAETVVGMIDGYADATGNPDKQAT